MNDEKEKKEGRILSYVVWRWSIFQVEAVHFTRMLCALSVWNMVSIFSALHWTRFSRVENRNMHSITLQCGLLECLSVRTGDFRVQYNMVNIDDHRLEKEIGSSKLIVMCKTTHSWITLAYIVHRHLQHLVVREIQKEKIVQQEINRRCR